MFDIFSLSRPAVAGDMIVVGTDSPNSEENFLMMTSATACRDFDKLRFISILQMTEYVRDIRWISPTTLLCAIGEGRLQLCHVGENSAMSRAKTISDVHSAAIREIAVKSNQESKIATGGEYGNIRDIEQYRTRMLTIVVTACNGKDLIAQSVSWTQIE